MHHQRMWDFACLTRDRAKQEHATLMLCKLAQSRHGVLWQTSALQACFQQAVGIDNNNTATITKQAIAMTMNNDVDDNSDSHGKLIMTEYN